MKRMPLLAPAVMLGALLAPPALAQDVAFLSTDLFGDYVPEGGVKDASGDFSGEVDLSKSRMCYYLEVADLPDPDGVGIYKGAKSESGPEVVTLTLPKENSKEVCVSADKELLQALRQKPSDYYIAVRNAAHPNGAIRGQLGK